MIVKQIKGESGRTRLSLVDDGDKISVVFWMPPEMTVDIFEASDIIDMGQTLSSVEQGEAHDAAASLDMGKLAENMLDSMNKLAIMGNLKGGKNEA